MRRRFLLHMPPQVTDLICRLSVAFIMSFFARALATIPGNYFCYSAISSGAIVLILPGYIIRTSCRFFTSK